MTVLTDALARRQYLGPYKVPFSLAGVPTSAKFVDRPTDTASLEESLLPRRSQREGRKIFVLHGLGGVGKTQLAVDFTRRHQAAFSTVFWLDGRAEDRLRQSIAGCVDRIPEGQVPSSVRQQAEGRSAEDLNAAVAGVMTWLGRDDNRDWLLVFDNVDLDHDQDRAKGSYDVRKYVPWDHGAVLITTRLSRLAQLAPPGYSRKLVKVDSRLGRAILEAWYGGDLGPGADDLLTLLDGLPLALAQAASYLRETGASIPKYLELYRRQWDKLMTSGASRPLLDYNQGSIATTWTISFGQIETKDGHAASLLRLWAFLDNKHLWHGLLIVAGRGDTGKRKWPQWLIGLAVSEFRFLEAVGLLLRYSMIEANEDIGTGYSMHPVVHKWASHLEDGSRKADYAWLALKVVGLSVPRSTERDYWVLQQQLLPHGQRCAEWVQSDGTNSLGLADKDQLDALHYLGILYANQGRLAEAEAMYQQALAGKEKAVGPDHTDTLRTVNNLGNVYKYQGRLAEAEAMYQRALAGCEKALGPDHTNTLMTVNNLGILYADQGRLAEAEAMYQRALAGCEKALGPDHTDTLSTVYNLGILYADQGRLAEAEAMYQRALAGCEKALGPDHTDTLSTVYNLGILYADQGRLAEAEAMYQRALAGCEKALGPDHTDTLSTVYNLGILYADQGRLAEAEAMYQRALAGYEKALGPDHPKTRQVSRNLKLLQESIEGRDGGLEGRERGKLRKRAKTKLLVLLRIDRINALKDEVGGNGNS
ncbi:protein O-GlcNAc transferase [Microdochium nivale]|nr:protein O-GlcNAc transferase [Microdochium nivale]